MDPGTGALLVAAGLLGGTVNAVVGSGTLITFPALLAAGLPPVTANGTNTTGLVVGSISSTYGYRRELEGRWRRLAVPAAASFLAACLGAGLVLLLPEKVFTTVVPWLIVSAAVLVAVQPRIARWAAARAEARMRTPHDAHPAALTAGVAASGVYGGYFGAAQGVVLMAVLGLLYDDDVQHANGAKNLMASAANLAAAFVFIAAGRVDWLAAVCIAVGALVGGLVGARFARSLPPAVLRGTVVAVGVLAAVSLLVRR